MNHLQLTDGKQLLKEFKAFALKGSLIDLSVAVVIGKAFNDLVNSLVNNILMPLLSYVAPGQASYRSWHLGQLKVGLFLGDVINFLIIAWAMFVLIVKVLGMIQKVAKPYLPDEPTTKECPFCLSVIPIKARKCSHCTADLPAEAGTPSAEAAPS
ncbi:MAG: large conductance mechanosensitive channel protein MscL [Isosphaeraceae bacterium]|nr:large conductance mechanosensitive channel protein MscL [Isosphaeraceae bacterium]